MIKKLFVALALFLMMVPAFAQDPPADCAALSQELTATREQLNVLVAQQADFRNHLDERLTGLATEEDMDSSFSQLQLSTNKQIEQKFGATAALVVASAICGSILTVFMFIFLRMRGIW